MKLKLTLLFILFLSAQLPAQEAVETDSIITPLEYRGYRVFISNPKIIKEKKTYFTIQLNVTNTGSGVLSSEGHKEYSKYLIINAEDALELVNKSSYEDLVYEKIRSKKMNLNPGESQILEFKVNIPKDRRMDEGGFSLSLGKGGTKDYSRDLCPDLILDSLVLLKRDKKNAFVEFQVKNVGKGAINIIGDVSDKADNIAVGAYFSGTKKYSKGALLAGQVYLTGLKESRGILFPGQSMKGKMKISRKKQSKYTKVLIIQVDSSGIVIECEENNNTESVLLR